MPIFPSRAAMIVGSICMAYAVIVTALVTFHIAIWFIIWGTLTLVPLAIFWFLARGHLRRWPR